MVYSSPKPTGNTVYFSCVVSWAKWLETVLESPINIIIITRKYKWYCQIKLQMELMTLMIHFMSVIHTVHRVFIEQGKSVHIHQTWPTIYSLNKWCLKSWLLKNICVLVPNTIHSFVFAGIQSNTNVDCHFDLSNTLVWQKRGLNKKQNGILRIRAGEGTHFIKSTKSKTLQQHNWCWELSSILATRAFTFQWFFRKIHHLISNAC